MRSIALLTAATLSGFAYAQNQNRTQGFDVTSDDTDVDFEGAYNSGARYASIRVTDGANTVDESAQKYWQEAKDAGLITQAFHRADPRQSSPKEQFDFFIDNGGDWGPGNFSLAGVLEFIPNPNPDEDACYGFESDELADWILVFGEAYWNKYRAHPTLRVDGEWWDKCTYQQDLTGIPTVVYLAVINYHNSTLPDGYIDPWFWLYWENDENYEFGGKSAVFYYNYEELKEYTTDAIVYPCSGC